MLSYRTLMAGLWVVASSVAAGAEDVSSTVVTVEQAYVDLHTGPGDGFPIFTVVERGSRLAVVAEQGDWYQVRTERREHGWLSGSAIARDAVALSPRMEFSTLERAINASRNFAIGINGGRFGDDLAYILSGSYNITHGLHAEISYAQSAGAYAMSRYYSGGLQWYLWRENRVSPGVFLMAGEYSGSGHATLVPVRTSQVGFISTGLALRVRLTDRVYWRSGVGVYSLRQFKSTLPNIWEWQTGVQTYF